MPGPPIETFRTHSNYIKAFSLLVHDPVLSGRINIYQLLKDRFLRYNVLPQNRIPGLNLDQINSSLRSAWGTEALLLMTKRIISEDELVRLSNNWSAIQVYYVFYHCTQALHVARGHPQRPGNHPSTQNIYYDAWAARSLRLPPWSLAYGKNGAVNIPLGHNPDMSIHSWESCEGNAIYDLSIKALMTTRREALENKLKEKRESKKRDNRRCWQLNEDRRLERGLRSRHAPFFSLPRLTDTEKELINRNLRPYTIMDYLYRLRIKTNYEDSNMFSDGPEDSASSTYVRNSLCRIANGTLFLHELAIRNLVGREIFLRWTEEWIRRHIPQDVQLGLVIRQRYLES